MPINKMYFCIGCISGPSASMRSSTLLLIGSGVRITRLCADADRSESNEENTGVSPNDAVGFFVAPPSASTTTTFALRSRSAGAAPGWVGASGEGWAAPGLPRADAKRAPCALGVRRATTAAA